MRAPLALRLLGLLVACAGIAILGPGPARADERAVLVVDATGGPGADVAERLTRSLGPDPALRPGNSEVLAALLAPTPDDDGPRTTAVTALAGARERLGRFLDAEAAAMARAAQDAAAGDADRAATREVLADLAFVEAMAIAGGGDLAAATPTFALVHRLSPGRTLDPARYLPEVIRAFDAAATPPPQTGMLFIAAPGATQVLVDGVAIGGEPVALQVAPGPHIVTARGEAIRGSGRRVEAAAGQTVRVDLILVQAPLAVRAGRARDRLLAATTDAARADAVETLLQLAGAKDGVVLVVEAGAVAARLYTQRGGLGPPRPVGDDLPAVLRPFRPVRPLPPPQVDPTPEPVIPVEPTPPWYRERWAKVSIGVGTAAVVIAVVAAIVTRDAGSSTLMPEIEVD